MWLKENQESIGCRVKKNKSEEGSDVSNDIDSKVIKYIVVKRLTIHFAMW